MSPAVRCLAAGILLSLPFTAGAQAVGYAAGQDTLFRIDLNTRHGTEIGKFSVPNAPVPIFDVEGLAFAPDGTLFGVVDNLQQAALIRINTTTGRATIVGEMGLQGQGPPQSPNNRDFGLAATCDGRLFASSDTTSRLWEVNPATGTTRFVGNLGAKISGLAAKADGLYGFGVDGDEGLYRIDTNTGRATLIGHISGLSVPDAGLDFDADGNLWTVLDLTPVFFSDIARVDTLTGQLAGRARVTGAGLEGGSDSKELEALAIAPCQPEGTTPPPAAASLPIPAGSPWSRLVLGLGLLAAAAVSLRRFAR
jgi:hypothetical protein